MYSFAIKNPSTKAVVGNINTTIPHMVFGGGIQPGTDYQLVIGVHNEAGMSVSAEKNFSEYTDTHTHTTVHAYVFTPCNTYNT